MPRGPQRSTPAFLKPQLTAAASSPPEGDEWLHEIEFDGYRVLALVDGRQVRLVNRARQDWTLTFPELTAAFAQLPVQQAVFDGEVALPDAAGHTRLDRLKQAVEARQTEGVVYFAFDLLALEGQDLTSLPLAERKRLLAETLASAPPTGPLRRSLHMIGSGTAFFEQACVLGMQGVVSKRSDEPYRPGDRQAWRKSRCAKPAGKTGRSDRTQESRTGGPQLDRLPTRPLPPVRLTNPDRLLYPESGITKHEVAQYYADICDWILPQLAGRPLSIVRGPDGLAGPKFFQKNAAAGVAPTLVKHVAAKDGIEPVLAVADLADLLALVQISTLEIHVWGSRLESIEHPDRLVIDLDPDAELPWSAVADAAREVRARLAGFKLESFLKTTGGKGLHVVAPLTPTVEWPLVKEFARQLAVQMATDAPDRYTISVTKAARRGKLLIDYLRNARGSTAVAAYSTRAAETAPISVPLSWDELSSTIRPARRTLRDMSARLAGLTADPWREINVVRQSLPGWVLEKLRHGGRKKPD